MPYELSIYKHRLFHQFQEWVTDLKDNPLREDAFIRAQRTYQVLQEFEPLASDALIPGDSVIREFIGGITLEV
jgi:uridine kinase